jgi:transposase
MQAISWDLRRRILAEVDGGMTTRVVATKYQVSESWVRRLKQRRRETGETKPRKGRPGRPSKMTPHLERLRTLLIQHPDATLQELHAMLDVAVCLAAVWNATRKLGYSFKKKSFGPPSKTDPTFKNAAKLGDRSSRASIPTKSFSSTKRGPKPT